MHRKIMIQGTGSSVGKTLVVAGLCRIFSKDGYKVSPFKSQNMALNSYVDIDGLEMSRGTVVQAECANEVPRAFMNPILLKPNSDNNSQVIVNGKVKYTLNAKEYFSKSSEFKEVAKSAYEHIEKNYDIGVLEGGGSPAEINLREYDFVNMGMAELVDSPVILVSNIDIGGVFASLYGTIMLLEEKDRKRIKGIIINKFRGDKKLLQLGIDMFESRLKSEKLNIKILGVLPYIDLQIEEEDSLSYRENQNKIAKNKIKISVIRLRKISNFTDFHMFKQYEDVELKYANKVSDLGEEDIIILPGSKNTITDLQELKKNGMFEKIKILKEKGVIIVGICAGLQMLGRKIYDPHKIESDITECDGFNFFDYETVLDEKKTTSQTNITLTKMAGILSDFNEMSIKGYEIHQGVTNIDTKILSKENIFVTYLHGIFDNSNFINLFLNKARDKKGLQKVDKSLSMREFKEKEYQKLEDLLRKNIDIEKIYEILL